MNNTALRAGTQSANNTHMVFANEEHEKFYYEKLEQARYRDCYHKALIYILGILENTRNYFSQNDMKSEYIKMECKGNQKLPFIRAGSGSVRVVRLAFNLYTDGTPGVDDYESREEQVSECKPNPQDLVEYFISDIFGCGYTNSNEVGIVFIGRELNSVIQNTAASKNPLKKSLQKWRGNVLKIRLMGTRNDIRWFEKILKRQPQVVVTEFSELYRNKGTNRFYRAYAEVQKANVKEN